MPNLSKRPSMFRANWRFPFISGTQAVKQSFITLAAFVEHTRVNSGCQQIISGGDGVDIAGHVQVHVFHRNDLGITSASRATFDAKGWTLRRLANSGDDSFAQMRAKGLA